MANFRFQFMCMAGLGCSARVAIGALPAQPSFSDASTLQRGHAYVQRGYMRSSEAVGVPSWTLYWGIVFGIVDRTFTRTRSAASLGAYSLIDTRSAGETRTGLLASISQQATSWALINVSLITGNNYFGALIPGAVLLHGQHSLWLGYVRGTNPRGNSGPALSLAVAR